MSKPAVQIEPVTETDATVTINDTPTKNGRKKSLAVVAPATSEVTWLQTIKELAPVVGIEGVRELMAMRQEQMAREAEQKFTEAFTEMQPKLPIIKERGSIKNRDGAVQSTYALWEDVNEEIKPILAAHGFSLNFRTSQPEGKIATTGILRHVGGHRDETTIELPHDTTGSKNPVQAVASSVAYGKRYTAGALLNLTSRGEDDDGQAAGAKNLTEDQVVQIRSLIVDTDSDIRKFCAYMAKKTKKPIEKIEDIPQAYFQTAVDALEAKEKAQL